MTWASPSLWFFPTSFSSPPSSGLPTTAPPVAMIVNTPGKQNQTSVTYTTKKTPMRSRASLSLSTHCSNIFTWKDNCTTRMWENRSISRAVQPPQGPGLALFQKIRKSSINHRVIGISTWWLKTHFICSQAPIQWATRRIRMILDRLTNALWEPWTVKVFILLPH